MTCQDDAQAHPIRARILEALTSDPSARLVPAEFARATDAQLARVNYHFGVLERLGRIEAVQGRTCRLASGLP